jgi:radical SAM protein with 4Fe4S-binding SPASM domain
MDIQTAREYLQRRISPQESYEDLLNFPRFIEIETVNACNARCPMCTIDDWQRNTPTMKDDLFHRIADEIIDHRDEVNRVSLYRDGEPLLDKKLPERIAYLKQGGVNVTSISTNVSLLDESRSRALLDAGLDMIILSIDSLQKEIFEGIRVRLDFDEVLANAIRFIELRNKIRPQTRIYMRMIRQPENLDEWPSYEAFWRPKLADNDRLYYHNLFNWGGQLDGFEAIAPSFEPNLPCVALWSLLVIFGNGDVPLCNVDYNNKYPTGNILENSIGELWRSKVMNERREAHLSDKKSCISLCKNCNVWNEGQITNETISPDYAEQVALVS